MGRLLAIMVCMFLLLPAGLYAANANFSSTSLGEDNQPLTPPLPVREIGNELEEMVFSVAGQAISVKNGGVLALHPDTPFRVLSMRSSAWLDFNLHAEIAGQPGVNLVDEVHTLANLLGGAIYQREYLDVLVLRKDSLLGSVRIMVRLLPIDWLRQAEASQDLEEKTYFLQKAYELSPDDRLLSLNLLDSLRRLGRLQQALTVLEDYPNLSMDADALKQQGYVYQAMGRLNEAIESFKMALALSPGDWDMTLALIELYENKAMWLEASGLLRELMDKIEAQTEDQELPPPLTPDILLRLARASSHLPDKIEQSLEAYENYLNLGQADHLLWLEVADVRARAGQAQASLAARRQALSLAPDNRDMIMQMQNALQQEDKIPEAIEVLKQGLQKLPEEDMLWLEFIKLSRKAGKPDELIAVYRQYVALHPQNYELHYYLALLLAENGRLTEAMNSLETALKLRPGHYDYLLELMRLQNQAGHVDQALETALKLLAEEPLSLKLWQELYALFGQKRARDMATLLDKALERPDAQPKLYEMRAMLALNQNQPQQAAQVLAKAAEKFPQDARVLYLLAGIYEGLNQDQQALPIYEAILRIDPNYQDAEERYLQVRMRLLDKRTDN